MKSNRTLVVAVLVVCLIALLGFFEEYISRDYFSAVIVFVCFLPMLIDVVPLMVSGEKALYAWLFAVLVLLSLGLFLRDTNILAFVVGIGALIIYFRQLGDPSKPVVNRWVVTAALFLVVIVSYFLHQ